MAQKIARLEMADRTYYRPKAPDGQPGSRQKLGLHAAEADVITWKDAHATPYVTLRLNHGPFGFQTQIPADEARLLAQALLMAADDADQAIEAVAANDEVAA